MLHKSLLALSLLFVVGCGQAQEKKPNIIYILTDDQRYDELGFMNPLLETPNMNAIAENGVHFKMLLSLLPYVPQVAPRS